MTAVLFILGGVHTRVIRNADYQTAVNTGISGNEQRVSRHVQTDVLHAAECSSAADCRTESSFQSHLFIGRPFAVDFGISCGKFGDFRAGGSGITGDKLDAGFIQTARHALIAEE